MRLLGHLVLGGIGGFAVGMARLGMRGWRRALAVCFGISVAIHFLWNWIALAAAEAGTMAPWQTLAAIALMLAGMATYAVLVVTGSRWSGRLFSAASAKTLWGWPFVRPPSDESTRG